MKSGPCGDGAAGLAPGMDLPYAGSCEPILKRDEQT